MTDNDLCASIAKVIANYRDGEFGVYDEAHVKRWSEQFEGNERRIVLEETNRILKRNFISRTSLEKFAESIIKSEVVRQGKGISYWNEISLLDIQKKGNSQKQINEIFINKLETLHSIKPKINSHSNNYYYIDDFIFSGNRVFNDLQSWITEVNPTNCTISIITLGWYSSGQYSLKKRLEELTSTLGSNIEIRIGSIKNNRFENRLFRKDYSDVFWPTDSVEQVPEIAQFLESEDISPKYRELNGKENSVFSRTRREEYENIIFKYGCRILKFSKKNATVVRPLGYHNFKGWGFGSTIFSYRNCPNNNPLVFWWGDPNAPKTHPFSKWYPLMQRNTYGN